MSRPARKLSEWLPPKAQIRSEGVVGMDTLSEEEYARRYPSFAIILGN
jgi:hypothetical protein